MLLAWRSTKRGQSIPAAQILGPGRVVPGLADVVDSIGDPELAWAFLTQEWPFEDTAMPPLELLKVGRTEEVVGAAHGVRGQLLVSFIINSPPVARNTYHTDRHALGELESMMSGGVARWIGLRREPSAGALTPS